MWRTVCIAEQVYLMKFQFKSGLMVQLTDLEDIWQEELSQDEFLERFQEHNPIFDSSNIDDVVKQTVLLVKNIPDQNIALEDEDDYFEIHFKTKIKNVPMAFHCRLSKCPREMMTKELIISLLLTIQHLEATQDRLCDLLERKDKEIQEHVFETGELSRKSVITEKFKRDNISSGTSENLVVHALNGNHFWEHLSKKYGIEIPKEVVAAKQEADKPKRKAIATYKAPPKKGTGILFYNAERKTDINN